MKKYILILLFTVAGYGQTLQSPTYNKTTTNTLVLKTNVESATANRISAQETDGKINWLQPINIPIPIVPTNYMPTSTTLGGHLIGIDNKLGTVVATTAGLTTRVWFTADISVVSATNYYATNATSKGTLASAIQNVVNNDNVKTYFAQDLIGAPFVTATLFPPGVYAGNLSASTSPNSAQQRWTVELYKCDNAGTPIASGVTGAPVGSLGVTVITILDSGLLTLVDGSVTNVQVSGNLGGTGLSMAVGERVRYHVSAEKVGTAGANITQSVYYGTSYNSYIDVPVPLNTTAVQNLSGVVGATTTDALNTLNTGKANDSNVVHKTGSLSENIDGIKTFIPVLSASSGVAKGTAFTPALTASANNDVLSAIEIAPTFNTGAFTNVQTNSLKISSGQLYVDGNSFHRNMYPMSSNAQALGSTTLIWGAIYTTRVISNIIRPLVSGNIQVKNNTDTTVYAQFNDSDGSLILQNGGTYTNDGVNRLQVTGSAKLTSSIQVGDNTNTASSINAGALRYRSDANNSYVDMCMKTGASTYAWVNIVQNTW